nr:helix-turn-helix domain protein [uncultured bacterium]AMP55753.1 helix-turn-helix domain protein [uncultured bacterium]
MFFDGVLMSKAETNLSALSDSTTRTDVSKEMRAHAQEACALLKTLANEDRLMLLCQLVAGTYHVGELEALLGIRQPTLSQQLGILRKEGLVQTERKGKFMYYSITEGPALRVMQTLWEIFCAKTK